MKTQFTQGEWRIVYPSINEPDKFIIDVNYDGIVYAHVYGADGTEEEMAEAEANAKLIAAAPMMYENHKVNSGHCDSLIDMINDNRVDAAIRLIGYMKDNCVNSIKKATE